VRLSSNRQDPFRALPWTFVVVAVLCIAFRAASVYLGIPNYHTSYTASHDRIDSLFFGALLGYFYHFRPQLLNNLLHSTRNRIFIAVCSAGLLSTICFLPRDSWFFSAFGYTCLYLGFGAVLLLSLYVKGILRGKIARCLELVGTAAAYVGMYSYSIYLWHGPTGAWFPGLVRRILSRFSRAERAVCDLYDRKPRNWDHDVEDNRISDSAAARSNLSLPTGYSRAHFGCRPPANSSSLQAH